MLARVFNVFGWLGIIGGSIWVAFWILGLGRVNQEGGASALSVALVVGLPFLMPGVALVGSGLGCFFASGVLTRLERMAVAAEDTANMLDVRARAQRQGEGR